MTKLVFEDLHWIDSETQALLNSLVESLATAQLLLLVNYRPEYQHGWGSKTYYTQLRLDPLPPVNADEFLQALLGNDPSLEPLTQLLIARTEGNPFFLEESVRTLVETGGLVGEPGAYRLAQALLTVQVPATVQAVLAARIDRLPPEEKRLLQTAAVIGTEVPFSLLRTIAELPEAVLHGGLAHLQAAEFLYETRLFPEREYTFKHALTHEVAYRGLLLERRRALHAQIVRVIEALSPDRLSEQVERLAHHAFRGEVWDKALTYFRQAGTKAATRSANREAVTCIEQALTALQHLPKSRNTMEQGIDLRFDLRNALLPLAEHGRIFDAMREAEALCEALDDQYRLGRVFSYTARSFFAVGDHDRAVESGQHALAIAAALGDIDLQVMTNFYLGVIYQLSGDYRRAIAFLRQTVAPLEGKLSRERFGLPYLPSVFARSFLIRCLAELGEFPEGNARGEEGCRIAEAVDQPWDLLVAYFGLGLLYLYKGDLRAAIPILERGLSLCQAADIPEWFSSTAAELGLAYALSGRLTEALRLLEEAVKLAISTGRRGRQSLWVARLSEGYLLAGRLEDATNHAMRAFELSREHKERGHQALSLRLLGEIAAHRDPLDVAQAAAHYQQALALAEELGMRPLQAHCHRGLGILYAKTGQAEQARVALSAAITLYRAMDMTFWLPQAEATLTQVER